MLFHVFVRGTGRTRSENAVTIMWDEIFVVLFVCLPYFPIVLSELYLFSMGVWMKLPRMSWAWLVAEDEGDLIGMVVGWFPETILGHGT